METPDDIDDSHLPMMQRKPWTLRVNRWPPKHFLDVLPQHLPSLIPEPLTSPPDCISQPATSLPELASMSNSFPVTSTARNPFGLSCRFFGIHVPSYEPDDEGFLELLSVTDHTNDPPPSLLPTPLGASHPDMDFNYYPYPNQNAFKLGDWFWNHGVQKSKGSFSELIKIIGHNDFRPADVRDVQWGHIDKVLGSQDEDVWIEDDSKWTRTPVTISVPFQSRRGISSDANAGPKNFTIEDFHHRSIVSIIREKMSNRAERFHFTPYELLWQPRENQRPVRVQGELYTSPAFLDAHKELQMLPGEPGCNLPRVVAALMFWSDATQLTSFGNAKLWPLYMFFGNESKYHRCRPSQNLCEHVAYFQNVSRLFSTG